MEKVSGTLSNVPGIANYESLKDKWCGTVWKQKCKRTGTCIC